ncbi:MAG: hypothetical protein HLUCCO17_09480 [Saliniramus fredricksonii]|uniref:Uncharacterized protein n=1 Tax=Saliniramus fredricksonii TaxID=1653334 RepID=A0A0P7X741_9HYPH|nr:hypothetical protein [Saliniramus fredricksonii]KPQ10910.1 MAG: hypothetical protein HLUCCO17_09480 [Saliniramus fredricksonii]SCC81135.1 hypothetical protein GA0071312_2068 [Saliniramus fredricksonii]
MTSNRTGLGKRHKRINKESKLFALLYEKLPEYRHVNTPYTLKVTRLCNDFRIAPQGFYNWVREDFLPQKQAVPLTRLSGSLITLEDLIPFVMKD